MQIKHSKRKKEPSAVYLYCLSPEMASVSIGESIHGIDKDYPMFLHTFKNIAAITSKVHLNAFTGATAEDNLNDIHWITPRVSRHAAVVDHVMTQSPVLPVRFGTIFSSLEMMEIALTEHKEVIHTFLSELGGKKEYAFKGFVDRKIALKSIADTALADASERLLTLAPGARYFEEKRINQTSKILLDEWLDQTLMTISKELIDHDISLTALKLQSQKTSGHTLEMVINWALLVTDPDAAYNKVAEIIKIWKPKGITFENSGPFPPYSFCPDLRWDNKA